MKDLLFCVSSQAWIDLFFFLLSGLFSSPVSSSDWFVPIKTHENYVPVSTAFNILFCSDSRKEKESPIWEFPPEWMHLWSQRWRWMEQAGTSMASQQTATDIGQICVEALVETCWEAFPEKLYFQLQVFRATPFLPSETPNSKNKEESRRRQCLQSPFMA